MTDAREKIATYPVTPSSMMVSFGEAFTDESANLVEQFLALLTLEKPFWLVDYIPSYTTVLIHYRESDSLQAYAAIQQWLSSLDAETVQVKQQTTIQSGKKIMIPVCYDPELAWDLADVAAQLEISQAELVEQHTSVSYRCYALGFLPGFSFLGRLPDVLVLPRLATPREKIPAGSVAIAEQQTTVYPAETPGGWRIIGRTPMPMFFPESQPPIRVSVGDEVTFYPISREAYECYEPEFPEVGAC